MKMNFILALALCCTANTLTAQSQICTTENFSVQTSGWTYSQGAREGDYNNPRANCIENRGIITPGVGGNNPCNIRTGTYTSNGSTSVQLTFDILCFDANLKCETWKDFDCETSVDVFYFVGSTKYTGITDQVLPPNGPLGNPTVNINMPVGINLPAGTQYQIQFEFKFKSGTGNCVQQNTKYVLDNFKTCQSTEISFTSGTVKTGVPESDFTISTSSDINITSLTINTTADYDLIQLLDNAGNVVITSNKNKSGTLNVEDIQKGNYSIRLIKNDTIISFTKKVD